MGRVGGGTGYEAKTSLQPSCNGGLEGEYEAKTSLQPSCNGGLEGGPGMRLRPPFNRHAMGGWRGDRV